MTNIKVIEKKGKKPGNKVILLAGVHGNELPGIKAFEELIPKMKIEFGKVTFIYANIESIKQNKRQINTNLNRCFFEKQPKDIAESLEGKTTREIMPYLGDAEFMLDIHASPILESKPFIICRENLVDMAKIFDVDLIVTNFDPFEPGSTDFYMNNLNKPGFCLECGYLADKSSIELAKKEILNFLVYTGNITGKLKTRENQKKLTLVSLYKNKNQPFNKSREFADFEKLTKNTLIGREGDKEIYRESGDIILFLRDCKEINKECFLVARELEKKI
jgi:predicted deacylase